MMRWVVLLPIVVCLVGCAEPTTGVVRGTVTVDGDLPKTGYIGFTPTDGKVGPSGAELVDGQYEIELPLGEAKVDIRVPKVVGNKSSTTPPTAPSRTSRPNPCRLATTTRPSCSTRSSREKPSRIMI